VSNFNSVSKALRRCGARLKHSGPTIPVAIFTVLMALTFVSAALPDITSAEGLWHFWDRTEASLARAATNPPGIGHAKKKGPKAPGPDTCAGGTLTAGDPNNVPDPAPNLLITKPCTVAGGPGGAANAKHYYFGHVHIYDGGSLTFADAQIDFWASSILVEQKGSLIAGTSTMPIGHDGRGSTCTNPNDSSTCTNSGVLTIHLYGAPSDPDIKCKDPKCGADNKIWNSNGKDKFPIQVGHQTYSLPGGVSDYFYGYDFMPQNMPPHDKGFFGNKVLAVSYDGTLQMYGMKGALPAASSPSPLNSGMSWARLDATVDPQDSSSGTVLQLDRTVDWQPGDQIVITTTDFMASHSELRTVAKVDPITNSKMEMVSKVTVTAGVKWIHNGQYYDLSTLDPTNRLNLNITLTDGVTKGVETRAAVALLSRSIRIVSGGDTINTNLPAATAATTDRYYGGHTMVRQGFADFEMQGVELYQLGQGGKIGHYPIHFHLVRVTAPAKKPDNSPRETFVKDCSIWDSMTRFITLHATQDVTLARNVGYLSIGHGYYLEDGSEIDNKLYSNIGIMARAAVINAQNPRSVPGILARFTTPGDAFPYRSDWAQPTMFWIMNGWNDFQGNLAAGSGTCGACYWFTPGQNSGFSSKMKWDGYAAIQQGREATSPLKQFYDNYCTSTMNSFITIGDTFACNGVGETEPPIKEAHLVPIANKVAEKNPPGYFPDIKGGGSRLATRCPAGKDCSDAVKVPTCAGAQKPVDMDATGKGNCMVTVLDHYTTSFNYSELNIGAIWLRPEWYLVINSAVTDILSGGLTFVTGGGFTHADAIEGYWALARKDVFIGTTQKNPAQRSDVHYNPYVENDGPFNPPFSGVPNPGLKCETTMSSYQSRPGNYCLSSPDGMSIQIDNFGVNQRFFNIYDGPSYEDSNGYADITPTYLTGCDPSMGPCISDWMVGNAPGVLRDWSKTASGGRCFLPNAAIAWKQPNGFYYPPAFHSSNLLFKNVPIRHFVIVPQLKPGEYNTNVDATNATYCSSPGNTKYFEGFTDIDRQTELDDDDGSLTGLVKTISVNEDDFFEAPVQTAECASNQGVGAVPDNTALASFATTDLDPVGAVPSPEPTSSPSPTARTSPYDYVTTVVFPKCAQNAPTTCGDKTNDPLDPNYGHGGDWSRACGGPYCFGVPLYREYLNSDETKATFIRMAGQSTYQRSTMTLNNNNYYIETRISKDWQNSDPAIPNLPNTVRSVNTFKKNEKYHVFLVYGKGTTKQTYQLYVGNGFNTANDLFGTRVDISSAPYDTNEVKSADADWLKNASVSNGVLTVTIDLSAHASELNPKNPDEGLCKPSSFCSFSNNACKCNASAEDYPLIATDPSFMSECNAVCETWAVKDLDCPPVVRANKKYVSGGCFGFSVKMADNFEHMDSMPTPLAQPTCFPKTVFDVPFAAPTPASIAGDCAYSSLPTGKFCP
jgi:cell migration-inducing and hyaluronan-binding protein